jgi:hypothetical protein
MFGRSWTTCHEAAAMTVIDLTEERNL